MGKQAGKVHKHAAAALEARPAGSENVKLRRSNTSLRGANTTLKAKVADLEGQFVDLSLDKNLKIANLEARLKWFEEAKDVADFSFSVNKGNLGSAGTATQAQTSASPVPPLTLNLAIDSVHQGISDVEKLTAELRERLAPVLLPPPKAETGSNPPQSLSSTCEFAQRLDGAYGRLMGLRGLLLDIHDRLAV